MKKIAFLTLLAVLTLLLVACGGSDSAATTENTTTGSTISTSAAVSPTPEESALLDLSGEWKQVGSDAENGYQIATIRENTIEVYWVNEEDDMKSLYWVGSYEPPTDNGDSYTWESINDTDKTDTALLASSAETKKFTYINTKLSYDATAMGVTKTFYLEKTSTKPETTTTEDSTGAPSSN